MDQMRSEYHPRIHIVKNIDCEKTSLSEVWNSLIILQCCDSDG